jgi:hypothetical protein
MGELLRQLGDFHAAVSYFDSVDRRSLLPAELVKHQRQMAVDGNPEPAILPPYLVDEIFMPKPLYTPSAEAAPEAGAEQANVRRPVITQVVAPSAAANLVH